ncbi:mitochondrial carrier domain-containing protein [Aspergillus coremiiformis]|uniref:Mitochondrial carrier domain-containing protein n=1 Tax=Aspergillus coremiiformis TaxID=138285 RepID=A0A5N6ZCK8_9EURO|nr:mitochondrial carrier domain-containing protein [Aspergillus coremiiformis]
MSSDFWAGYLSGAIGIIIGNPLDLIKVRLQANRAADAAVTYTHQHLSRFESVTSLLRGAAAPILGYGGLNALLFVAYNRSLMLLDSSVTSPTDPQGIPLYKVWLAGAAGGVASWAVSSPTEFIKCRAQLDTRLGVSSWTVAKDIVRTLGWRGLYFGGGITCARDSIGYGFYFWTYEYCKRLMASKDDDDDDVQKTAMKVLLCGGVAGVATWASIYPLDMIKTRLQAQALGTRPEDEPLMRPQNDRRAPNSFQLAKETYRTEGLKAFYRGLGVCSVRAFIVNAVQWASYEWLMRYLNDPWNQTHAQIS